MSIRIMSAIFDTEFRDLPLPPQDGEDKPRMAKATSIKIVMLALADHANDEGECYPGLTKLETKTALSRQGVIDVISAIKYNGLAFISDEPSKHGSNFYTINLGCFPRLQDKNRTDLLVKPLDYPPDDQSSHLTTTSQATLPELVKPLDLNHQLTTIKPSLKDEIEKNLSIENTIFLGKKVTQKTVDQQSIKDIAPKMFEKALGFSKPLPWWSNKDWTEFAEWVCARYSESKMSFGEYNIWRNTPYTKGGCSNVRIRGFIKEFYDSWDMFMMSKNPVQEEPVRPEHVRFTGDEDESKFITNPFKKPDILRRPTSLDSD